MKEKMYNGNLDLEMKENSENEGLNKENKENQNLNANEKENKINNKNEINLLDKKFLNIH